MRLHRSALFAGLLALGVAACGDDVQIVEAPPPPPPALNATLAPNASTIFVGAVADYGVGVSGGAVGETATWTCTSAAPSIATVVVTATGCRATGVAAGNTSISVVVTKGDQTANASSGITVNAITTVPARLSITGLSMVMPGPPPVVITAPINAIQGQLDVDLTLTRNTETPTLVELLLGGVVVASQTLTNQAPAEVDGQQVAEPIQFSFNTAFYTVANNVATPRHLNGSRVLSARVTVTGGTVRTATETVTITLVNPDQVHVQNLVLPTTNALSAAAQIWYGGPNSGNVGFTAVPVLYSGRTTATIGLAGAFGGGCANPGADATVPYDFASSCATAENAVNPVAGGFNAQATDGNAIFFGAAVGAGYAVPPVVVGTNPFPVFIDKVAPVGAVLRIATQGGGVTNRENWVGGTYPYSAGYTAPTDAGVGLPTNGGNTFQVHTGGFGVTLVESGNTTAAGLMDSVDNLTYFLRVLNVDRLGNSRTTNTTVAGGQALGNAASSSHTLATFGKDAGAPSIARGNVAGDVATPITTATATLDVAAAAYQVQGTDIVSGFAAPAVGEGLRHSHISVLGTPHLAVLTTAAAIGSGAISATPFATANAGTFVNTPANNVGGYVQTPTSITTSPASVVVPLTPAAYYIYQAQVRDKAGNLSPVLSWQVYRNDSQVPQITGLVSSVFFAGGAPAIFPAIAQDAVEVAQASFDLTYGAVGRLVYERPSPSTATLFDDVITIPNPFNLTAPQFIRALQTVDAAPAPNAPVLGQTIPGLVTARAYNGLAVSLPVTGVVPASTGHADTDAGAANGAVGAGAYVSAGILPTQVQAGVDYTTLAATVAISNFEIVSYGVTSPGSSVIITVLVRATGASGTFQNPFMGGLHMLQRRAAGDLVPVAATPGDAFLRPFLAPVTVAVNPAFTAPFPTLDNGLQRDYDWNVVITYPSGAPALVNLQALGLSAGFDGLLSREVQISTADTPAGTLPAAVF
jgi:hypothetical protein